MKRVIKSSLESHDNSKYIARLREMINDGTIDAEDVLDELLQYLPPDTVDEFASDYLGDTLDEVEEDEDATGGKS